MPAFTWLGHGTYQIQLDSGEVIVVDPWLEGNPKYPAHHKFDRVDVILLTHGHFDHINHVVELAKKFSPTVVAIYEAAMWLGANGVPGDRILGMNKGGTAQAGPVEVTMTHAIHSAGIQLPDGTFAYGGEPAGFVVWLPGGRRMYLAGDTTVFSDMALIEQLYRPEIAVLPIGDLYTMGPREAALACRLLKARKIIPVHWGTFPPLTGTPAKLAELIHDLPGTEVLRLEPGAPVSL